MARLQAMAGVATALQAFTAVAAAKMSAAATLALQQRERRAVEHAELAQAITEVPSLVTG